MRARFTICCRCVAHFEEATCSRLRHITAHLVTNQQLLSLASACVCVCVCVCASTFAWPIYACCYGSVTGHSVCLTTTH